MTSGSKAPYDALDIANYIVCRTDELNNGVLMSNIRIQKVLYFVQLFYLRDTGKAFFVDDIEAWKYGPVVPVVYRNFSVFGAMPIRILPENGEVAKKAISHDDQKFIDMVLEKTKGFSVNQLIDITHRHEAWISSYWSFNHTITLDKLLKEARRDR